jgi:hypothetical protein
MTPTAKLRCVDRVYGREGSYVRILQHWWEVDFHADTGFIKTTYGEWRDVPLEEE